jgi:hypothetical protein
MELTNVRHNRRKFGFLEEDRPITRNPKIPTSPERRGKLNGRIPKCRIG